MSVCSSVCIHVLVSICMYVSMYGRVYARAYARAYAHGIIFTFSAQAKMILGYDINIIREHYSLSLSQYVT